MLDKLNIDDIKPSSTRYPSITYEQEREAGDQILEVEKLSQSYEKEEFFQNISLRINRGDKIAVISKNNKIISAFYQILVGIAPSKSGNFSWGITTKQSYLPADYASFFENNLDLINWLRQYIQKEEDRHEGYIRKFLGKMLFSGDEALKKVRVLSGGEKMRCMLSRMMLLKANVLIFNEPTNHLDLESITALNNSLNNFKGTILISSQDHELLQTICNRIIELGPKGSIDRQMEYDEYLNDEKVKELRKNIYLS